jgi:hypothetical protein
MVYSIEIGSNVMLYIPSFIKIASGIQKLLGGIHMQTRTHREQGDLTSLILFFQNKESRLIKLVYSTNTSCTPYFTLHILYDTSDFYFDPGFIQFYSFLRGVCWDSASDQTQDRFSYMSICNLAEWLRWLFSLTWLQNMNSNTRAKHKYLFRNVYLI